MTNKSFFRYKSCELTLYFNKEWLVEYNSITFRESFFKNVVCYDSKTITQLKYFFMRFINKYKKDLDIESTYKIDFMVNFPEFEIPNQLLHRSFVYEINGIVVTSHNVLPTYNNFTTFNNDVFNINYISHFSNYPQLIENIQFPQFVNQLYVYSNYDYKISVNQNYFLKITNEQDKLYIKYLEDGKFPEGIDPKLFFDTLEFYKLLDNIKNRTIKKRIGLFIGKFRLFHIGHIRIVRKMLRECEHVSICIVGKSVSTEIRLKMIERIFGWAINCGLISIYFSGDGFIPKIINSISYDINTVYCGDDRYETYRKQLKDYVVDLIKIERDDVSSSKIFESGNYDDYLPYYWDDILGENSGTEII